MGSQFVYRPVTEFSPESDKILQSPLGGSSKNVKNQVSPIFKTRRFLGYKKDDSAYATSGSIVDCILEMSKAAYQLKDHLRDQKESFGNLTVVNSSFVYFMFSFISVFYQEKAA